MEFEELNYFLRWRMRLGGARYLHQPVTIKALFENKGTLNKKIVEKEIIKTIKNINVVSNKHVVYEVLKKHDIINEQGNVVNVINFDRYSHEEIQIIINICQDIIDDKNSNNVKQLCDEFHYWCETKNALSYKQHLEYNKIHLKNLIKKFKINNNKIDINEFFPFPNQTSLLHSNEYVDMLTNISDDCDNNIQIEEMISNRVKSAINIVPEYLYENVTMFLFYLNNTCPMINTVLNEVYNEFAFIYDINNKLSNKLSEYDVNLKLWNDLLDKFKKFGITDMQHFQIFCYWYNKIIMNKPQEFISKWEMLEFPEYNFDTKKIKLLSIPINDQPDIKPKEGFVILLDNLGTKTSDNEAELLSDWHELVQNWEKHFGLLHPGGSTLLNRTQFNSFSDTIMITIEKDDERDFITSLNQIGDSLGLFIFDAINMGIFFRGCISYGAYVNSKHACIGRAVNDASAYYESTNWIGISLSPLAYQKLQLEYKTNMKEKGNPGFERLKLFRSYEIPLKIGNEFGYALHLRKIEEKYYKKNDGSLYTKLYDKLLNADNHDVSLKYRNTLLFLRSDESTNKPLIPR